MTTRRNFVRTAMAGTVSLAILPDISTHFSASPLFQLALGVCTTIDNSSLVKRNHFDFVEETVSSFFIPAESDEKYAENLNKLKQQEIPLYAVNSFIPGALKCVGPEVNAEAIMAYAATTLKRMDQANVRILVFGSGGSRKIPDGFDTSKARNQFIEINKRIAPLAEKYNVTIVLEPLNYGETNLLNTVEEGIGYVDEINHPNIRLLADIYHMLKNGEPASSVIKAGKLIRHMHIAEKDQRTAPGVAGDDFRNYFKALETIQYKGKLAIECRWKNMEAELPQAFKTIRNQMGNQA